MPRKKQKHLEFSESLKKGKVPAEVEPRNLTPEFRARMDRLVEGLAHLILVKVNPEAARERAGPL